MTEAERWQRVGLDRAQIGRLPPEERPNFMFGKLFGAVSAPAALADLLPLVRSWRPALVVHDAAELAAPIAAAAIGVPHVTHS